MNDEKTESKAFPFEHGLSPASAKLMEKLKTGKIGDIVTDEELTGICGKNTRVGEKGYANLQTAIRRTLRDYGLVWMRIPKAYAIKCLDSNEIVESLPADMERIRHCSKKALKRGAQVEIGKIPEDMKMLFFARQAQLSVVVVVSENKTTKQLAIRGSTGKFDQQKLLEAFIASVKT